ALQFKPVDGVILRVAKGLTSDDPPSRLLKNHSQSTAGRVSGCRMRGDDQQQDGMFSYISPNKRVPQEHPLRRFRSIVDRVFDQLSPRFNKLYARAGRPSIAPEKLLRALLLQLLYSVRSERLLMELLDYNLLFRWFVGLSMDDAVWDASTVSKNRERMREGNRAEALLQRRLGEARAGQLL